MSWYECQECEATFETPDLDENEDAECCPECGEFNFLMVD